MRQAYGVFMEVILPVLILVVCGFVVLVGFVAVIDYASCKGFESGTGMETRWHWGCYAKVGGQWVPSEYAFGDAHELRVKDKR